MNKPILWIYLAKMSPNNKADLNGKMGLFWKQ